VKTFALANTGTIICSYGQMARKRLAERVTTDDPPTSLKRLLAWLFVLLALASCANTSVRVTGIARPPVNVAEVRVYTFAPPIFDEVAQLSVSRSSLRGGERAIQKIIDQMKSEAANLGANGLLLEDFADGRSLSVGTAVGTDTYTHNSSISLGVGSAIGIVKKIGAGRAIYIAAAPH
jgi:hypothetical protein